MNIRITRHIFQFYSHDINSLVFLNLNTVSWQIPWQAKLQLFFVLRNKIKMFSQIFPKQLFSEFAKYVSYLRDSHAKAAQKPPWRHK